jgi:hypothetical protein
MALKVGDLLAVLKADTSDFDKKEDAGGHGRACWAEGLGGCV